GLASRTIALASSNAARSCAVLISELPATLLRTPSKTFGGSRPYGRVAIAPLSKRLLCSSTRVQRAMPIYPVALSSLTNSVANNLRDFLHSQDSSSPAAWAFVGSDIEAVCLRHF